MDKEINDLIGKEKGQIGNYSYLNIETTKENLVSLGSKVIFNKGYIPDVFKNEKNPDVISWLHIDLNSSLAWYS